ncbi:hypothetical protein E2C01_061023 [Portunus trituberculatus]|uniref:Uncharacterized protein n=1 Tax=Portunus trituberculatus TaxID=210409 RepID=A0A5B7HD91_PORTR|nr:hypothetical protein [Portunus trituberculatus]
MRTVDYGQIWVTESKVKTLRCRVCAVWRCTIIKMHQGEFVSIEKTTQPPLSPAYFVLLPSLFLNSAGI